MKHQETTNLIEKLETVYLQCEVCFYFRKTELIFPRQETLNLTEIQHFTRHKMKLIQTKSFIEHFLRKTSVTYMYFTSHILSK